MKNLLLITVLILLAGCSATIIRSAASSKYGPMDENRTGEVRYFSQGAQWIVEQRREDAYKKMHDDCNGKYVIDSEHKMCTGIYNCYNLLKYQCKDES